MKKLLTLFAALTLTSCAAPQPHVIVVQSCGVVVGVIFTNDPPEFYSGQNEPDEKQQAAMREAVEAGRVHGVNVACSNRT